MKIKPGEEPKSAEPELPHQQRTVSFRVADAVSRRLEGLRKVMERRRGGSVSMSDVAKLLLESAREDRLEVVDLLGKPAESLLAMRRKHDSGQPLSWPEWAVLSFYLQQGAESFPKSPLSRESLAGILQAFLAAYELRGGDSGRDEYYMGNLPTECRPGGGRSPDPVTPEVVRRTVEETLRRVEASTAGCVPTLAARNLNMLLEDEKLAGAVRLNEVLRPFWPVLWRVAVRGYYWLNRKPLRDDSWLERTGWLPPLLHEYAGTEKTPQTRYSLSFVRGRGNEFSLLLSLPEPRKAMYPMGLYPMIAEFRAMLAVLPRIQPPQVWDGECFFGYLAEEEGETQLWFRAQENGVSFGFSRGEWAAIQALFRRAWENPELQRAWAALSQEYGEL